MNGEELQTYINDGNLVGSYVNTLYVGEDAVDEPNDYHFVKITDEDGQLTWTVRGEDPSSWTLVLEDGELKTSADATYPSEPLIVRANGNLKFLDEPFKKQEW